MDVLNSFGSEAAPDRSDRMRSWYLLEQYKALEQSQLIAAERLRSRSYQDGLLSRELTERRQRRRLTDDDTCSDCNLQDTFSETRSLAGELYEHLCECHDDELHRALDTDASADSDVSVDDSKIDKPSEEFDYETEDDDNMREEENEDLESVVENVQSLVDVAEDIKEQIETARKDIAQNIQMQLAFGHSPPPSEFEETAVTPNVLARHYCDAAERVPRVKSASNTSVQALWSKLVSFAYQVTQLNHGNCYCDYSSQLLTAVLAFDVVRRGLCGICNVLQPYVSPIKFPTDDKVSEHNIMSVNKKQLTCKWRRKPNKKLRQRSKSRQLHRFENAKRVSYSDELHHYAFLNEHSNHVVSEPWRNVSSQTHCEQSQWCPTPTTSRYLLPKSRIIRPEICQTYSEGVNRCEVASGIVVNPMLKVVHYADHMLDLDDEKYIF